MARIAGIQIEKDVKGRPAYARINLKKHPEALEFLNNVGAVDEDPEWKNRITGEEFKRRVIDHVNKKDWK